MKLPLLISVPHAGWVVPPEVRPYCSLTSEQIAEDGDEGASQIYRPLRDEVVAFVDTDVARAIVDQNRAPDDRRADGVVKTHTCWQVPVYGEFPPEEVVSRLLGQHYHPYHAQLTEQAPRAVLGVDCHTMAAAAPPIGPDAGQERPPICLSNADGTCSGEWLSSLADRLEEAFGFRASLNEPFKGGYIIRSHQHELPWVQLELSRAPFLTHKEKSERLLAALRAWCVAEDVIDQPG